MASIYGSQQSSGDGSAGMTPLRRQPNPSGAGGWSGGFSNGGGHNTEGSQRALPTGFDGGSSVQYGGAGSGRSTVAPQAPRWGGTPPQSGYAQSSPYAAAGPHTQPSYARPQEGVSPNAQSMAASNMRGSVDPGQQARESADRAAYVGSGQADYNPYPGASVPQVGAGVGSMGASVYPGPQVAPQPIPIVAPPSPTTATPDQLMAARFNVPGVTQPLGLPAPAPVATQDPRRLPAPALPQSTYGGMFAR